ncbi:MAG: hypothetical protein M0Q42_08805 [Xanthomonadales bacterium]|nr:hypothetical protein [Xanthomonadales bacterium]
MALVVVAQPGSEPELAVMLCALESHRIPVFVQGAGFGSLYPGPQVAFYNARRIMVPRACVDQARQVLEVFNSQDEPAPSWRPGLVGVLRLVLEFIAFGWFVPGNRQRAQRPAEVTTDYLPAAVEAAASETDEP